MECRVLNSLALANFQSQYPGFDFWRRLLGLIMMIIGILLNSITDHLLASGNPPAQQSTLDFGLKILGAGLVIAGLFLNWRTHSERSRFEMIDRLYALGQSLENHVLTHWRLAHLLCITKAEYEVVSKQVQSELPPGSRNEMLIKERTFALYIFIVYEQILYQRNHSWKRLHSQRRRFLEEMLGYFTGRLLKNPRLLGLYASDSAGIRSHLEESTVLHFAECVDFSKAEMDRLGPFQEPEENQTA